jgi:hypothetical protein
MPFLCIPLSAMQVHRTDTVSSCTGYIQQTTTKIVNIPFITTVVTTTLPIPKSLVPSNVKWK